MICCPSDIAINVDIFKISLSASHSDLNAHREGRDVLLAFAGDVGSVLRKACNSMQLARAAKIVWRDMQSKFTGMFEKGSHYPTRC